MTMSGMWNGQSEFSYSNTVFCVGEVDLVGTAQKLQYQSTKSLYSISKERSFYGVNRPVP